MSSVSSGYFFNPSLAWSMGNGGEGHVRIMFPFDMGWYNEQPCTQFQSLEHRKEPKGLQHEFIVLRLDDGSVCRIERMGDPNARFNALSSQGSVAHDVAQCYRPDNIADACLSTSEIVTEIVFPHRLDLIDVLKICRAIHEGKITRNYTLFRFNCYFFSLAIQCCLARLVIDWEKIIPYQEWILALDTAFSSTISTELHCLVRAYSVLNPNDPWSVDELLQSIRATIHKRSRSGQESEYALGRVLWYWDLGTELSCLAQGEIKMACLEALTVKLGILLGQAKSPSLASFTVEMNRGTLPSNSAPGDGSLQLLRAHCMVALMRLVDSADPGPSRELRIKTTLHRTLYRTLSLLRLTPIEFGPKPCSRIIINDELNDMVSKLEHLERIGTNELAEFLHQIHALCKNPCAERAESPWDRVCQTINEHLPSDSDPPVKEGTDKLQVRFKDQAQAETITVSKFQGHILSRVELHARTVEKFKLGSASQIQTELRSRLSQVWGLIRSDGFDFGFQYDEAFYRFLAKCKMSQGASNTLKRFLGIGNQGRAKIKTQKLKKALKAIGFETKGHAKGFRATFVPLHFTDKTPITFHWPHGASLEYVELRNKANSFKNRYPMAVSTLERWWSSASP